MHILSTSSKEELKENNLKNKVGFMYQEDGLSAYNWSWFSEGACEMLSLDLNDIDTPYIYGSEIKAIEAMKLSIFDIDNSLENVIFSSNINDLYNLFPHLSKEEVNKMFYAYTIIMHSNNGQEGSNFYKELSNNGVVIESGKYDSFNTNLKGSILLSLSKEFYINLANKINDNTTLEDIFKVISVFELEVSRISWYQSKNGDLEYFLSNYCKIQDMFFSSLNMDLDYIKNLYYMYNNEVNLSNIKISFLSDEENSYLNYINESRTGNKKNAILKVYSDNFRNLQKIN